MFHLLVDYLKFLGPFKFKLVAPMSEQLKTISMKHPKKHPFLKLPAKRVGAIFLEIPFQIYKNPDQDTP